MIASLCAFILIINFVVSVYMKRPLHQFWSLINFLQLAVHMPLYLGLFPANANLFVSCFVNFVTFEILPRDSLNTFFNYPIKDAYNESFQMLQYESMYSSANARTVFIAFHFYVFLCLVHAVAHMFKDKCKCGMVFHEQLNKLLFWNPFIRFCLEIYLELSLVVFISLGDLDWDANEF